ncbi:tripartite tricarboxylate transporter TctB family protein [Bosea sp. BH3]|uniref:tripartite tricarboxylate transporter TctB family protein n=1 Tax=Bosea sp. BH3 TaxID=2871701 RepID=UPI0021CB4BC6|nr:tripartite tricarboxylate transporter TctB family protein [Bosea sp. BH3]MCU4179845.1 tripartite tricarboxylate transporter TctB family protein [Bosea sp. BH3]
MSGASAPTSRSLAEIVFAILLIAGAAAVIFTASGYPGESATYPVVIGAALAGLGCWVLVREVLRRLQGHATPGSFAEHAPRLAIGLVALVLYVLAVSLVGFILPSVALGVLLPASVGFRRWGLSFVVAVISVVSILLIFVLALERPIPPDILSPLGRLFR